MAGAFNPPTTAHVGLISAAKSYVDEVLCIVPRAFPHKPYFGATLEQRIEMLEALDLGVPASIATTEQGLFIDIARECRAACGPDACLRFVCGRDAAERILTWDYGRPGVAEEMLREFDLLVAARGGEFTVPREFRDRIVALVVEGGLDSVSSTEVRDRIAKGERWIDLVPREIVERVREIYS